MTTPAGCQLIGRWRIVEADLRDRDYLDLDGPATITISAGNHGKIAFGAMQATLELGYGPSMVLHMGRIRRNGRGHRRRPC
ncbi:hypothetical protein [Mesorhizobium sp.]|uniref:hypothetical protein n=1 Tax=Mesorhizobium sp. TaxID=1871066 RepID=UPI0025BBB20A|nr:hypothetical protein [Mesorhizobium sp.]